MLWDRICYTEHKRRGNHTRGKRTAAVPALRHGRGWPERRAALRAFLTENPAARGARRRGRAAFPAPPPPLPGKEPPPRALLSGCAAAGRSAAVAAGSARPGPSPSPNSGGTGAQAVPAEPRQLRAAIPASTPPPRTMEIELPPAAQVRAAPPTPGGREPGVPANPPPPPSRPGRWGGAGRAVTRPAEHVVPPRPGGRAESRRGPGPAPSGTFPPSPSRAGVSPCPLHVSGQVSSWRRGSWAWPRPLVRFLLEGLPPSRGPQWGQLHNRVSRLGSALGVRGEKGAGKAAAAL